MVSKWKIAVSVGICVLLLTGTYGNAYSLSLVIDVSPRQEIFTTKKESGEWNQYKGSPSHSGGRNYTLPESNDTIWEVSLNEIYSLPPVIHENMLVLFSENGNITIINASTGDIISSYSLEEKVYSCGVVDDKGVTIGINTGEVVKLTYNFTELWNTSINDSISQPLILLKEKIVCVGDHGRILAIDSSDGGITWTINSSMNVKSSASNEQYLLIGGEEGVLCIDISNGSKLWNISVNITHVIINNRDSAIVTLYNGTIERINLSDGKKIESFKIDGDVVDISYINNKTWCALSTGDIILIPFFGNQEKKYSFPPSPNGTLIITDDKLFIPFSDGKIEVKNYEGVGGWNYTLGGNSAFMAMSEGRIFAISDVGRCVAFGFMPNAIIDSPSEIHVKQGEPLILAGHGTNGTIINYSWESNLDGLISNESQFSITTLSIGNHKIYFKVQDSNYTWSKKVSTKVTVEKSDYWLSFHLDNERSGSMNEGELVENNIMWRVDTGQRIISSPIIVKDFLYIGIRGRTVEKNAFSAYDPYKGTLLWSFPLGSPVDSYPAYADGLVFFGSDDFYVYALDADPSDGKDEGYADYGFKNYDIIWRFPTKSGVWGSPVVVNGKVLITSKDGNLYALDEFTGEKIWNFSVGEDNRIESSPAVSHGIVVFGSEDYWIYGVKMETGKLIWKYRTQGEVSTVPCIHNNTVYIGSDDGRFYALDLFNGSLVWKYDTKYSIFSSAAYWNGKVFFGSYDSNIYCLDAKSGEKLWNYTTGDYVKSSPIVINGTIYVSSFDRNMYAIDAENGKVIWKMNISDVVWGSPAYYNGVLYIGTENGKIIAFGKSPDMKVERITFSHGRPKVGQSVKIYVDVKNVGTASGKAEVWVSDGPLYLGGILIGNTTIALDPEKNITLTFNWTASPGERKIVVNITNTTPYESNLKNNGAYETIFVTSMPYGWPMYKHDSKRTGVTQSEGPNTNRTLWIARVDPILFSSPIVSDNWIFVCSNTTVTAFDKNNGKIKWSRDVGEEIRGVPLISKGCIIFGTLEGSVYSLDCVNGRIMWKINLGESIMSSPCIVNNAIFIGTLNGKCYGINEWTGRILWMHQLNGSIYSSPAADENSEAIVWIATDGENSLLCAINTTSGTELWNCTVPVPIYSTPVIADNYVYICTDEGTIYCFELIYDGSDDGIDDPDALYDTIWIANISKYIHGNNSRIRSSPAYDGGILYFSAGDNTLIAFNIEDKKVLWSKEVGKVISDRMTYSSPAISKELLYIGFDSIYCLKKDDGGLVWTHETEGWVWASPAISRGWMYIGDEEGKIYAFGKSEMIPPKAIISYPPVNSSFRVDENIEFDASSSYDIDGYIANYTWNFGDGHIAYGPRVSHSYNETGTYIILLKVEDNDGNYDESSTVVVIRKNYRPILMNPTVSPTNCSINDVIKFTVVYMDADNDTPSFVRVVLKDKYYDLIPSKDNKNFTEGVLYFCDTKVQSGIYAPKFVASDGVKTAHVYSDNITIWQDRIFLIDVFSILVRFAGRGGINITTPVSPPTPPPPLRSIGIFANITTFMMEKMFWANVTLNYSYANIEKINESTLRLYVWDQQNTTWVLPKMNGINVDENTTWVNVTHFSLFGVFGRRLENLPPVAIAGKDQQIYVGEVVVLNASASYDPDGDSIEFYWDFDARDGIKPEKGSAKMTYKYDKPGRYVVTLVVSDGEYNSSDTVNITVKERGINEMLIIVVIVLLLVLIIVIFIPVGEKMKKEEEE